MEEVKYIECPRCNEKSLHPVDVMNALSRREDLYICSACGMNEAMEELAAMNE